MMTKRERVQAVILGKRPDTTPVSFWYHFPPNQARGQAAVDAHVKHLERYDLDFLKIMNDHWFPRVGFQVVQSTADLKKIRPLPGEAGELAGQLEVIRKIRQAIGDDIPACTTIFNPWSTLRQLTRPPSDKHGPPKLIGGEDDRDTTITRMLRQDRSAVKGALDAIGQTIADFASACIRAGGDGVFLSCRDDWVDRPANSGGIYEQFVRPVDERIMQAASVGSFNVLHICGRPQNFDRFARYPGVHVLSWADRAAGPRIGQVVDRVRPAIAAGVDNLNTLPKGTPDECRAEVQDALAQAGDRPIMIAPGCTFDPNVVPEANLETIIKAAHNG